MSQEDFAESIETTPPYLSQILTMTNRSIGLKLLLRIKMKYPAVDLNWLIAGTGEMFLPAEKNSKNCPHCKEMAKTIDSLKQSLTIALNTIDRIKGNKEQQLEIYVSTTTPNCRHNLGTKLCMYLSLNVVSSLVRTARKDLSKITQVFFALYQSVAKTPSGKNVGTKRLFKAFLPYCRHKKGPKNL